MTPEQLAALAAHIRASTDPLVVEALAIRNDTELARLYNLASAFVVWRSSIPVEEYRDALEWTEVDTLTVGKARAWEWITGTMQLPLESGKAAVRDGLAEVWAANTTTRANLLAIAKRQATVCESIYLTGVAPTYDLGWEGTVTITEIGRALNDY